jgi:hypothetical protein
MSSVVDTKGLVDGRSGGQAEVSASYRGRRTAATVVVTVEDALRIDNGQANQGAFTPGRYRDDVVAGLLLGGLGRHWPR